MNTVHTMTVVRGGRVTVNVPVEDGTGVHVIIIPRRRPEQVAAMLQEADHLRAAMPAQASDPLTLKQWIEEGRP